MKEVLLYFEGPSDIAVMEVLFGSLIAEKAAAGVSIKLLKADAGDRKQTLLEKIPVKAARILQKMATTVVAIVPDLYPPNKGPKHSTFEEMREGAEGVFAEECDRIAPGCGRELSERFKVFCFKYDLEVLLLASPESLKNRLGISTLSVSWAHPVEDQNHGDPPKFVVRRLFERHGHFYDGPTDAPLILSNCDYRALAEACPQCFKPFVEFLENL